MDDLAVVADVDEALQAVEQGVLGGIEHAVVDDQGVELVAGLEAAYLAEERACRLGGYPEGLRQRQEPVAVVVLIVHLAHLDGIDYHAQHVQLMTATDVASQTYAQSLVQERAYGCET